MERLSDIEGLVKLFEIDTKNELKNYCKRFVLYGRDLSNLIGHADAGLIDYAHKIHYRDIQDPQLQLDRDDFKALGANGPGPVKGETQKVLKKITQLFVTRRNLVGHLFYTRDFKVWHFFYWDQRDTDRHSSNWKLGPHIHLINYLWPGHSAMSIRADFVSARKPKMTGSLHVHFHDTITYHGDSIKEPAPRVRRLSE